MADWPQWRGPNRNGVSSETISGKFSGSGPKQVWKATAGEGYSSLAVKSGKVYTMGNYNNEDYVVCYDALTGKLLWQHKYPCGAGDYAGPRATPVVSDGNVYTLSREGQAFCLNANTGKVVWQSNVARETGANQPQWGFGSSALVQGNLVLYNVGAAGCALDKKNGRMAWKSGGGPSGYASPVAFSGGVAMFHGKGVTAVNPTTGARLWNFAWDTMYDVNAADPIFSGDSFFLSSNYNKGGALIRIGGNNPSQVWFSREMRNHFNACVLVGGNLYGNDEGRLRCIDWATGRSRWEMRGMGKGGVIAAGDKLIALTERGELVIAAAAPGAFTEISRAKVLDGECWTQPALANGMLYARNHEGAVVCLDLR
jgi:outer membrane protein assembly factor BamB